MAEETKKNKLITPVFRVCFPAVFAVAKQMADAKGPPKFEVTMVFEPGKMDPEEKARLKAMMAMADAACVEKFKKPLKDIKLPNFHKPFRDGEEKEHLQGFGAGTIFAKASSKMKPGIVASDKTTPIIDDPTAFYAGCYARATVGVYAYDNVSKGVSFGLRNLMFVRDGEHLDGRTDADEDFGDAPAATEEEESFI